MAPLPHSLPSCTLLSYHSSLMCIVIPGTHVYVYEPHVYVPNLGVGLQGPAIASSQGRSSLHAQAPPHMGYSCMRRHPLYMHGVVSHACTAASLPLLVPPSHHITSRLCSLPLLVPPMPSSDHE